LAKLMHDIVKVIITKAMEITNFIRSHVMKWQVLIIIVGYPYKHICHWRLVQNSNYGLFTKVNERS
jgi:hypothetical protein